jgi:hypothetical protein
VADRRQIMGFLRVGSTIIGWSAGRDPFGSARRGGLRMADRQVRLSQAEIRLELRGLEVEIQKLRREQQFYKRMGFASDIQDMQMVELIAHKRDLEQLQHVADLRAGGPARRQVGVLSWVMLLPMLVVMAVQALVGRAMQTSS